MTERFRIYEDVVDDSLEVIPITVWSDKKQQKKYCDALNELNDENEKFKTVMNTILRQIDTEVLDENDILYSARIIFTKKEFDTLCNIWRNGDLE